MVPAALAADLARATAGNAPASSGSKVHECALVQSTGLAAPATRSGHASACAMGIRMSGGLAWAIGDPSVNSTMEGMTDWRSTTTSMASNPIRNRRCDSLTSKALFASDAEVLGHAGDTVPVGEC